MVSTMIMSKEQIQEILDEICEGINVEILCSNTDSKHMNEFVLLIDNVTVTSFVEPVKIKEDKKASFWKRMFKRFFRK